MGMLLPVEPKCTLNMEGNISLTMAINSESQRESY